MPQSRPSPEALRRIDQIVNDLRKATMAGDPNLVEFVVKSFPGEGPWKARFGDENGVLLGGREELIFAAKQDVIFTSQGKALSGNTLNATFRIRDRTFSGGISPQAFERCELWKSGGAAATSVRAPDRAGPDPASDGGDSSRDVRQAFWLGAACTTVGVATLPFLIAALLMNASDNVLVPLGSAAAAFLLLGGFFLLLSKCFPGFFAVKGKRSGK
jgi:hypothetical protein